MAIRLPLNGQGPIIESRAVDGRERQLVAVMEPIRPLGDRAPSGRIVWADDFDGILPKLWNDGLGILELDDDIISPVGPSLRLDTNGQSAGATTNPGRTAVTSGVIAKMRIHDNFAGRWGMSMWFRLTSLNNTSNAKLSMSIYNRTGIDTVQTPPDIPSQEARHFRVWLDPNGNNQSMVARILDGAATAAANSGNPTNPSGTAVYTAVATSWNQNGGGSHTYDVPTRRLDRVGGWHYVKMVVDFATGRYVSLQLDSYVEDISTYEWDVTASTGFAGMHQSIEYHGNTSTNRYVNIAGLRVTLED